MKKIFRQTAAMLIALLAVVSGASHAENIADDPFIRQNLDRANFEPGGQYHLFNSRGKVAERSGSISVIPFQDFRFGDFRIQQAGIRGDIGYTVRFSGHGHEVHSPFDNHARRQANDERGNVNIGLSLYQIDWSGHEHHPADGYDGPQGGGYPAPKGARDEYSYHIEGQAQTTFYAPTDTRSTMERLKDRYANMPQNFANRSVEANKKIFDHNDRLNRWGNGAETVNGLFAAVANGFQSVGEAVGVGDAIDGIYRGGAIATMHGIDQLPSTKAKMDAIGALGTGAGYIDSVSQWAADNPNATEMVKAGANIGTAAWSVAKGVKAGVSGDFADAAVGRTKQRQMSDIDGEMAGGNKPPKATSIISNVNLVINETNGSKGLITSKYKLSADEALEAGIKFLGKNYQEIGKPGSGVYRSADGTRQFRIDKNSLDGKHAPNVPHFHLERIAPNTNKIITNNHIELVN